MSTEDWSAISAGRLINHSGDEVRWEAQMLISEAKRNILSRATYNGTAIEWLTIINGGIVNAQFLFI